ncbi:hypothetical protein TCON_2432 [Astathelohania contejeani]|uniref:Uncharacterized protein n=1 Tax=Astathelohania contejeani TaxID=164912 RepID=A0ABQ7HW17_9MICR|nr:hypothetical protein TCON_2432 [Thelohania contejeani]
MYAKRNERRREHQCFELYKGRFYRKLSGESQMVHGVDMKKIKEYWSTMWDIPNVTNKNYEKYLVEYLPESEYTTTFATFKNLRTSSNTWPIGKLLVLMISSISLLSIYHQCTSTYMK